MIAPVFLMGFREKQAAVIIPMCAIEEYAMIRLMSFCRNLLILASHILSILIVMIRGLRYLDICVSVGMVNRMNPYVPSFRSIPASSTDPMAGASTWASGSHLCQGIRGVFIAKAKNNPMNSFICVWGVICVLYSVVVLIVFSVCCNLNMVIKRGRDPIMVYSRK